MLSKRCSRMPLIGLVRLRWALWGENPRFDPIGYGRCWATRKRRQAGNGLVTCYSVKVGKVRPRGRIEKAQPMLHRKASEAVVTRQDCKAKAGAVGTLRNQGSMNSSTL